MPGPRLGDSLGAQCSCPAGPARDLLWAGGEASPALTDGRGFILFRGQCLSPTPVQVCHGCVNRSVHGLDKFMIPCPQEHTLGWAGAPVALLTLDMCYPHPQAHRFGRLRNRLRLPDPSLPLSRSINEGCDIIPGQNLHEKVTGSLSTGQGE